jgi:uroporphyrinogen III methyltransferase/synthase
MTVYLVGGGPGDPGLITVRGAEVLRGAEVVLYDRLSAAALLALAPAEAERISVGKTPGHPSISQDEINALLVRHGRTGRRVVRLKGGDPFVFGRGGEEAAALADAGVPFEVVPGIPAAVAVPAYAGIPVTQRGVATSFTVVTGQGAPWASAETDWEAVARVGGTILVYMAAAVRGDVAARLIDGGLVPETPVAAVTWGTVPEQRTVRTTLAGLAAADVAAPAVIVIGDVAAIDLTWFEQRPLFGRRVVVTRPPEQATELVAALAAQGAAVVEAATIAIGGPADGGAALRAAAEHLAAYAWVVLSSANAVERLMACVRDARSFGPARVGVVGTATAAALGRHGVAADLVPADFTAAALIAAFPAPEGSGAVLVPQSARARPTVADGLAAKGWRVDAVTAYETVAAAPSDAVLLDASAADAIVFSSPSTVDGWLAAGPHATPPVVACIGPVTAAAARERGVAVTVVADDHTAAGVAAALATHFSSGT